MLILSGGKTRTLIAPIMQKIGVNMVVQNQGMNGRWEQRSDFQRIIVVFAARVKMKVSSIGPIF